MNEPKLPWEGGCLCGRVRLEVNAPPLLTMACHCSGCQRLTSSAYSLSMAIPSDGFEVTRGEPVIGALHGPSRHYYCSHCMSWMFTRPEGMDWFVNLRATMLDEAGWFEPYMETATSEGLGWARTPAIHSFEGFPPMEDYQELVKGYAEKRGRPAVLP